MTKGQLEETIWVLKKGKATVTIKFLPGPRWFECTGVSTETNWFALAGTRPASIRRRYRSDKGFFSSALKRKPDDIDVDKMMSIKGSWERLKFAMLGVRFYNLVSERYETKHSAGFCRLVATGGNKYEALILIFEPGGRFAGRMTIEGRPISDEMKDCVNTVIDTFQSREDCPERETTKRAIDNKMARSNDSQDTGSKKGS